MSLIPSRAMPGGTPAGEIRARWSWRVPMFWQCQGHKPRQTALETGASPDPASGSRSARASGRCRDRAEQSGKGCRRRCFWGSCRPFLQRRACPSERQAIVITHHFSRRRGFSSFLRQLFLCQAEEKTIPENSISIATQKSVRKTSATSALARCGRSSRGALWRKCRGSARSWRTAVRDQGWDDGLH